MKAISIIFAVVGLAILAGAYALFSNTQDFLDSAVTTNGIVVDLLRSDSSDSIVYHPAVEFSTQDGTIIEFTSSAGTNPPSYSRGEIVTVLYQESFPERAKIKGFFTLWGAESIVGTIGGGFLLISITIMLVLRSNTRKQEEERKSL